MLAGLLLSSCKRPFAQVDDRRVWVEPTRAVQSLGGQRRRLEVPVSIAGGGGESLSLVAELECDRAKPEKALVSVTRLQRRDVLLGLDRRDPSLERSWAGGDMALPPAWLRRLLADRCPGALPSRWSGA
jgi:hypothetical protein